MADWRSSNGWPGARSRRATFAWAAPEAPGTSTITATIPATGQVCSIDMNVIAPASISMIKDHEFVYPAGTAGAGMALEIRVHPRSVNFGWLSLKEDPGPATGVSGYFATRAAAGMDLSHHPNPAFVRFTYNNAYRFDSAFAAGLVAPWTAGAMRWRIPNRYRAFNSTGAGRVFTRTLQTFAITALGTVTVTKQGRSVTRSP
jgi:hypothetical protein